MHRTPKRISQPSCYSNQSPLNDSFSEYSQSVPRIIWDNTSRSPFNPKYNEKHQKNSDEDIAEISKVFVKHQDKALSQTDFINPFIIKESQPLTYSKKIHQDKKYKLLKLKEQAKLLLKQKDQGNDDCQNHVEPPTPNLWDISVNEEDLNFLNDAEVMLTQITDNFYDKQRCKFNTPPHKSGTDHSNLSPVLSLNYSINAMAQSPHFNLTHNKNSINVQSKCQSKHKLNPLNRTKDISMNMASQSPIIPLFVRPKKPDFEFSRKPLLQIDQNRKKDNASIISKHEPLDVTIQNLKNEKNLNSNLRSSCQSTPKSIRLPEISKLETLNPKVKCSEVFDDYISEDIILALTQDDDDFF